MNRMLRDRILGGKSLIVRALVVAASLFGTAAWSQSLERDRTAGKNLIIEKCSGCHGIGLADKSKHSDAPAFRTIGRNYPVGDLAESLAEGIMTGHPDMPVFQFTVSEVDSIIAYLESIQTSGARP